MFRIALSLLATLMLAAPVQAQASAGTSQAQGRDQARTPAFTLDTPIERLVADPRARAVLNRELPGLTTHDRYDQFKGMSLKALKPFSGGLITDARLEAVRRGLAEL